MHNHAMAQNVYYPVYPESSSSEGQIYDTNRSQPFAEIGAHYSRPYVGIAVVCRCTGGQVLCILQRKGQNSFGSLKWSFPGGRLDQVNDLEENGSTGTRRKLLETCGGGTPNGLPPLIHIIWSQSGKNYHTLYHVFSIDPDADTKWLDWHPAPLPEFVHEVDTSAQELLIDRTRFECKAGNCWVDLECLGRECYQLDSNPLSRPDLHRGLINWVQVYAKQTFTHLNMSTSLPEPRLHRFPYPRRRHSSLPVSHYVQGITMDTPQLTQNFPEALSHLQSMTTLPSELQQPLYPIPLHMPQFMNPAHRSAGGSGAMSPQQLLFNPVSPAISPTVPNPTPSAPTSPGGYAPTSPSNSISSGSSICLGVQLPQYKPYDRATDSPKSFISEPPFPTERPSTADSADSGSSADERKSMPCQYFLAGHCNYGDNCWYYHPSQAAFQHYFERDSRVPLMPPYPQYSRGRFYLPAALPGQNLPSYPALVPPLPYLYPGQFSQAPHHAVVSPYSRYHRHYKQRPIFPYFKVILEEKLRLSPITGFTGCQNQVFIVYSNAVLIYDYCNVQNTSRINLSYQSEETFATFNITCIQGSSKHLGIIVLGCADGTLIAWNWISKQYLIGDAVKPDPISALCVLSENSLLAGTMDGRLLMYHFSLSEQQHIECVFEDSSHHSCINDIHSHDGHAVTIDTSRNIFGWKLDVTQTTLVFKSESHDVIFRSHLIHNFLLALSFPHPSTQETEGEHSWPVYHMQPTHIHTSTIHEEVMSANLSQLSLSTVSRSSLEMWDLFTADNKPMMNKCLENEFTWSAVCHTPNGIFLAISSVLGEILIIDCYSFNVLMTIPAILQSDPNAKCQGIYSQCAPRQESQVFNINILSVWSDGTIKIHNCRL